MKYIEYHEFILVQIMNLKSFRMRKNLMVKFKSSEINKFEIDKFSSRKIYLNIS